MARKEDISNAKSQAFDLSKEPSELSMTGYQLMVFEDHLKAIRKGICGEVPIKYADKILERKIELQDKLLSLINL